MGLDLHKRICTKCNLNVIEDANHAIMSCPAYQNERNLLFDLLAKEIYGWHNINTEEILIEIMKIEKQPLQTGKFMHHIMTWEVGTHLSTCKD